MTEKTLLFDSHCHLDDGQFDQDRQALLDGLPALGIAACLTCGSDLTSSKASLALTRDYPYIYAAAGIHPHEAAKAQKDDLLQIAALLDEEKVVALGEIGLDFYYDFSPRALQEELLNKQLDLALEKNLPVVL
ncbi:MAG: TatD family hydrolase, partial [Clostridiales bacterium]|nr:TatD family hydrolase [Clostridiales bacterium]